MEKKAREPLFKLSFWSFFPKLPTKWRKQAQKSSNIWHKPSRRCSRGPLDISPHRRQTRLRTVRPQCAAAELRMRKIQPQLRQENRAESAQPPWHCPRAVWGADCSLSHRSRTRVWDSEPASPRIQSWADAKEEGTMEPATWCWGSSFTVMV